MIKLDDLELIKRSGDGSSEPINELRTIYAMEIIDKRNLVELSVPDSEEEVTIQDMGDEPPMIYIAGEIMGPNAKEGLEKLLTKCKTKPVRFYSELTEIAEVNKVMLEYLNIETVAGSIDRFKYEMLLSVYTEPITEEEQAPPSQEEEAEETVRSESEIDDIRGQILDTDGNPLKDITVKIKKDNGDEWQVKTDSDGYYEVLDVPEGKYEIIIEREGYEDIKKEVEISKGK